DGGDGIVGEIDGPNSGVLEIRNVQFASCESHAERQVKTRRCRGSAIAREPLNTITRNRANFAVGESYLANYLIISIRDIEVAGSIQHDLLRCIQRRVDCRSTVA